MNLEGEQRQGPWASSDGTNAVLTNLHQVHCDNSRRQYFARLPKGPNVSIMAVTPFVFEFFVFNSLYQVNWVRSSEHGKVIFHPENWREKQKQKEFINYVWDIGREHPENIYRSFDPLTYLPPAEGDWTRVTSGHRISSSDGMSFFKRIRWLQSTLEKCASPTAMPNDQHVLDLLKECTRLIYNVRNNIFHGSKTLGEVYELDQKRRLLVYELFLKGLTSLFFLSIGKPYVASDFVPCPVSCQSLTIQEDRDALDLSGVWDALDLGVMKLEDSRLISQFTKKMASSKSEPRKRSSLFYPSAGIDLLTPLLVGLPYCTDFYFYELGRSSIPPQFTKIIRSIPGLSIPSQQRSPVWQGEDGLQFLDFEFNGISRRLHWMHKDNKDFLDQDVELSFYFHRGDSWGEGGSGQQWDSELLPELMKKIPSQTSCVYLTDGEPGGIDEKYFQEKFELSIPFIERNRKYYCGRLHGVSSNLH